MRLVLIHQSPGEAPIPAGAPVWRTCLREVAFVGDRLSAEVVQPVIADADAYSLLLEIVCGLRSPLVGETEVQAQFKTFLASLDPQHDRELLRLGQRMLTDAKLIRGQHLQGFGAHSYGPLAARHVPAGRRVALIGTGALATKVAAALDQHVIDRWGRRNTGEQDDVLLLSTAKERPVRSTDPTTFVIAAPVSSEDLSAVAGCYSHLMEVVDLRAGNERTPWSDARPVITLDHLFSDARTSNAAPVSRLDSARREILRLGQAYGQREELHPFGWDDLCA